MRTMYDGITPSAVPAGAAIYAGYVNGSWPSHAGLVARFPKALHVTIAVNASADAMVLDVEKYDATPAQAPGWALRQRARGNPYPVIYCNQMDPTTGWPAVKAAFAAQRVAPPLYWVAKYDGDPTIPAGAIAKQYANYPGYDVSSAADYWPGLDPTPVSAPAPTPEEDEMAESIKPLSVYPNGKYAYDVPDSRTQIRLTADGDSGPGAELRFAFWQHDNPLVVGESPNPVKVGGNSGHHTIGIKLPVGCTGVTVTREDQQDFPVALGFHA